MSKKENNDRLDKMLSEMMEELLSGELPKPEHERFCNCGTCQEAFTSTLRLFEQSAEYHCPMWWMQIATFAYLMGKSMAQRAGDVRLESYRDMELEFAKRMVMKDNWDAFNDTVKRIIERKAAR